MVQDFQTFGGLLIFVSADENTVGLMLSSSDTSAELMELCKAATLCLKEDTQIETSLTESLQAYLNGQASVEEAMDAVEGSLKMYLAE